MKTSIWRYLAYVAALIIAVMPFHAFLTVWGASFVGHYTLLRLWKEVLLAGLVIVCLVVAWRRPDWRTLAARRPLGLLVTAYIVLCFNTGLAAYINHEVPLKAFAYGWLTDTRFLWFFGVVWLVSRHNDLIVRQWRRLLLIPAVVVVSFALLQFFVLPPSFLSHFGYGPQTIAAVQTVDQKAGYQRVQSTLRGANPLGAYLIVVLSALAELLVRQRRWAAGFTAATLALALTFSRSAWLGALLSLGFLAYQLLFRGHGRRLLLVGLVAAALAGIGGYSLRGNDVFQNTFLHTDEHSQSATSSNAGHLSASSQGLRDVLRQPLGGGTGSAGPASAYNRTPARIAENYYIQVGQETGWLGLVLFVVIVVMVGRRLWQRRDDQLALVLLASLLGISLIGLLSHVWADDTLAYVWWGLAGAALSLKARHAAKP